jgi:rod shape-determining protein MreC
MHWRLKNFLDASAEVLEIYRSYFIFLAYLSAAILLFQTNSNTQMNFIQRRLYYLSAVIGRAIWETRATPDPESEIRSLREKNIELTKRNIVLEDAYLENVRLRQMLRFAQRFPIPSLAARIIAKTPDPKLNAVVINKGADDGVALHQAVMTDHGLAGKVIHVDSRHAVCQLLLDETFRVAAKIQRTRLNGIVQWQGEPNEVQFYGVLKNLDVRVGDVILTSEYSEYFPPNFMIGVVSRVNNEVSGIFKDIRVHTSVDFNRLEEIFVVTDTSHALPSREGFENYFLNRDTP